MSDPNDTDSRDADSRDADSRGGKHPLLSEAARSANSSAIRDILIHARRPDVISLAGGVPSPALFPLADIVSAVSAAIERDGADVVQYGVTAGEPATREVAATLTGTEPDPEAIVITTGSQQALDLIARVLIDPGDQVVVADPDYLGALQSLRAHKPELVAIPLDADGMRVDVLAERLAAGARPKLCYVVANFHNPTGATLAADRRVALTALAEQYGFLIVEDDPYGELRFTDDAVAPIGPGSDNVVRLRSVSKVLAPGLRIGWLVGPEWLVDAVVVAKQSADLHTSTLSQAVMVQVAGRSVWMADHLDAVRTHYRNQRDVLTDAIADELGERITYNSPQGGMFVWGELTGGADTSELMSAAIDNGVAFVPGAAFAVDTPKPSAIRLSFATAPPDQLWEACRRLRTTIDAAR